MKRKLLLVLAGVMLFSINAIAYESLQKGSNGNEVYFLQQELIDRGYLSGEADGDYGELTEEAVASFQTNYGLEVTGIADDATQAALFGTVSVEKEDLPEVKEDSADEKEGSSENEEAVSDKEAVEEGCWWEGDWVITKEYYEVNDSTEEAIGEFSFAVYQEDGYNTVKVTTPNGQVKEYEYLIIPKKQLVIVVMDGDYRFVRPAEEEGFYEVTLDDDNKLKYIFKRKDQAETQASTTDETDEELGE